MLKIWEEVVGSMMLREPGEKNHWQEYLVVMNGKDRARRTGACSFHLWVIDQWQPEWKQYQGPCDGKSSSSKQLREVKKKKGE